MRRGPGELVWVGRSVPVFVEGAGAAGATFEPGRPRGVVEPATDPDRWTEKPGDAKGEPEGDPRLFLRHVGRESARTLRVSRVGIWRFEEAGSLLRLITRYDQGDGSVQEERAYSGELASSLWSVLGRVRALAVNDTLKSTGASKPLGEWIDGQGIRSVLALPVRMGARLVGFVTFEECRSPRNWTPRDRELASALAAQVADALQQIPRLPETSDGREARSGPVQSGPTRTGTAPASRRNGVRRLPRLEGAAILGAEEVASLLAALDVQDGYLRLLEEALQGRPDDVQLAAEAREVSERIRRGLHRFLGCVRGGVPDRVRVELNRVVADMIPVLSREAGPDARLRIAPTASTVRVDVGAELLERALVHLVRNAREASSTGQDVRLSWGPVIREASEAGETSRWARIRISDEGHGIGPAVMPWLFEPFFSNRSDDHPLRGLGLPLVQAVVEGHGGWIEIRSSRSEGTEVDLFLPVAGARSIESETGGPPDSELAEPAELRAPRILLVEDEPLLARLLRRVLTREGYVVDVVEAPADAEPGDLGLRNGIDLLITERELTGGVSGIELATLWRSVRPDLPAVLLDRNAALDRTPPEGGEDVDAETEGGLPLLSRPFEPSDVLARVRDALGDTPVDPAVREPATRPGRTESPSAPTVSGVDGPDGPPGRDLTH